MINLPFIKRESVDTSITQTSQRCPRKAYYQYYLNRAPGGINVPIGFGLAYHKFREVLEKNYLEAIDLSGGSFDLNRMSMTFYKVALAAALEGYEDPPIEHNKSYLTRARLQLTCEQAFTLWMAEKRQGRHKVLEAEQAFELELPNGQLFTGRFDQLLEWNGRLWVRDFKTTSRMGSKYGLQFNPNDQMTAYTWAASQLSGRQVTGVLVDVVYNTKTKGPEHHPFISAKTQSNIDEWLRNFQQEIELLNSFANVQYFPMRTTACGDFGGCYFRECCSMGSDKMREAWLRIKTVESYWDPMNPDDEEGVVD